MKGKYMENPDYIINCYKKGKLVKDIEIKMDEEIFKNQIKEGILNYLDVNSGEVEYINLNQFDYYEIKDVRIKEKKIPEKIDQNDTKWEYLYSKKDNTEVVNNLNILRLKINEIIDYLKSKGE